MYKDWKKNPLKGLHPSFLPSTKKLQPNMEDWSYLFLQENGQYIPVDMDGIYNATALHSDEQPPNIAWMVVLRGRKTFWFLPPGSRPEANGNSPVFTSAEAVQANLPLGLRMVELREGDLLVFPGNWLHEVHNTQPTSLAVTNAVPVPMPEKAKPEPKPKERVSHLGKRRAAAVNHFALDAIEPLAYRKRSRLVARNLELAHSQDSSPCSVASSKIKEILGLADLKEQVDFSTIIAPGKTLAQAIEHHYYTIAHVTIGPSLNRLVECYKELKKKSPTLSAVSEASEEEVRKFFTQYFSQDYQKVLMVKNDIYKDERLIQAASKDKALNRWQEKVAHKLKILAKAANFVEEKRQAATPIITKQDDFAGQNPPIIM